MFKSRVKNYYENELKEKLRSLSKMAIDCTFENVSINYERSNYDMNIYCYYNTGGENKEEKLIMGSFALLLKFQYQSGRKLILITK